VVNRRRVRRCFILRSGRLESRVGILGKKLGINRGRWVRTRFYKGFERQEVLE